ncbi:hypothetical protein [Candidatus Frankia alpina]|nr:hypothetical protein [Candidatus Frankia alpina]
MDVGGGGGGLDGGGSAIAVGAVFGGDVPAEGGGQQGQDAE